MIPTMRPPVDSSIFIGLERDVEARARERYGGCARRFHGLAQRIMWGVTQSDLVRLPVETSCRAITREFPTCAVSHLYAAFGWQSRDDGAADHHLEMARQLAARDRGPTRLVPTSDEWIDPGGPRRMREHVSGRMWRVTHASRLPGVRQIFRNIATVVRHDTGQLTIVNPVPCSPRVLHELRDLGPVTTLIVQGKGHSRDLERSRHLHPRARVLLTSSHRVHPPTANLRHDALLGSRGGEVSDEFQVIEWRGSALEEVLLLHRPTRVLITQDLFAASTDQDPEQTFAERIYDLAFGIDGRFGLLGYQPLLWTRLADIHRGVEHMRDQDVGDVLGAHFDAPYGTHLRAYEHTLAWIAGLSRRRLTAIQARVWLGQPHFLAGFVRYLTQLRRHPSRSR